MSPAVHQFHQSIRHGDAIGEEILALRTILRQAGYTSEIFVSEAIPEDLRGEVRDLSELSADPTQLLLVHHSIGHYVAGLLSRAAGRRALVYHNITPSRFFVGNPFMQRHLERGRRQTLFYRDHIVGAFADSNFNARDLYAAGFADVRILPPVFGIARLARPPRSAAEDFPAEKLVLFAGRIARSKCQIDVLEAFETYASCHAPGARLVLVGGFDPGDPYTVALRERLERSSVRDRVELTGWVDDSALAAIFRRAALYLSMSEHEGFGVPLLESFSFGVPVLAFDAGAVAETMGGSGVLFRRKKWDEVAGAMASLISDPGLRRRVVEGQFARLGRGDLTDASKTLLDAVEEWRPRVPTAPRSERTREPLKIQIEGPFETSYGLAVANRRLAEAIAIHGAHRVSIYCTEGPGDYLPKGRDLSARPFAHELWRRSFRWPRPDVSVRNMYPPRFDRGPARFQLASFYWEDSVLPEGWAEGFVRHYDGILAPSTHVRDVLVRSGVSIPIEVVPTVVAFEADPGTVRPADLPGARTTRFLSVSSAFPRKGVDVLLRAYFHAFSDSDDVTLVVKSFPNIHNTVASQLAELRASNPRSPHVIHVDRDMSELELLGLYKAGDVLVHPARAEGFGLPPAEALLLGLPVIATAATALADFCNSETVLVVPHRMAPSQSHFARAEAEWAEPDEGALSELLRGFADGRLREEARRRARTGRDLVRKRFSAVAVARRAEEAIETITAQTGRRSRVALVSTWNSRCGIATYSAFVAGAVRGSGPTVSAIGNVDAERLRPEDDVKVARVWSQGDGRYDGVVNEVLERQADVVHVQFHPGLFTNFEGFSRTIEQLADAGRRVIVTLHLLEAAGFYGRPMVPEQLVGALQRCERLLVHNQKDRERLVALGLGEKTELIPHGGALFERRDREETAATLGLSGRRVVAYFGFALPHKGVLETIEAIALLLPRYPDLLFLALAASRPEREARDYIQRCRARIVELDLADHVVLLDDFLTEDEVARLLSAAEVVVLPYLPTLESASGAVRYPLACGRATVTTAQPIFEDVAGVTLQIPSAKPAEIARGLGAVLDDPALRADLEERAWRFAEGRSWENIGRHHIRLYGAATTRGPAPAFTTSLSED